LIAGLLCYIAYAVHIVLQWNCMQHVFYLQG